MNVGDIETARKLANKLKTDNDFYQKCSKKAREKYKECFGENIYIYNIKKVIKEVVND